MLNTRDLERRWLKYKIKSYVPHVIITLSVIVILISLSVYYTSIDSNESIIEEEQKATTPLNKVNEVKTVTVQLKKTLKQNIPTISSVIDTSEVANPEQKRFESRKKVVLKPSMEFMKNIQGSSDGYYQNTPEEETFNTPYVTTQPTEVHNEVVIEESTPSVNEEEQETKKIVIARETSVQDIKDAEKRFNKNNNPALSLFLAKQYYARGDYSKSYNYALVTNQLDKDNEDSWLIFSRSLVKLGKINLAKKALKEYIKFSHSTNAQLLLDDITTGKFR
jgi:tetratricopeptide (TPR) repeat protein